MRLSWQNKVSLVILLTAFAPLTYWGRMEGCDFPSHFNLLTGVPDNMGDRYNLLFLLGFAVVVYILMVLCCRYPNLMNYPAAVTDKNKQTLFPLGVHLAHRMNILLMMVFSLNTNCASLIAIGVIGKFPVYLMWISLLYLLIEVIRFVIRVRKAVR